MGRPHQGAEHHRRGERRYPDGSNAGDVVKAVAGTPGINRAASIARKPRRSNTAWTFLSLARRMTVASSCVRPAVRASAKEASTVPEIIAGRDRAQSADVFATGMRDQSRLIVRAASSITASC